MTQGSYRNLSIKVDADQTFEQTGSDTIYYVYDTQGQLISMILNNVEYAYLRNAQNDIVGLINSAGTQVVAYTYSTWGEVLTVTGSLASTLGAKNPYRYRGYRYDSETGLYYLQSRYYNPQWGRFLNADNYDNQLSSPNELSDKNLFAYCDNNPVTRIDIDGEFWFLVGAAVGAVIGSAISVISQYKTTRSVNWGVVGVNAVAGSISGALASTGAGLVTSMAINSALGGATYAAEQAVQGNEITASGIMSSIFAGGIGGAIGGKGINAKGLNTVWKSAQKGITRELRRANVKYATKQIAKFALKKSQLKI